MTTATLTKQLTSADPAPTTEARPRRTSARRFVSYTISSLKRALTDWAFLAFVIVMPVALYTFFSAIYGDQVVQGGVTVAAVMMITMAAYGGLGAAMNSGAQIQAERTSGWMRQLMVTPLTAVQFFAAKVVVAVMVVIPALAMVFLAGAWRGVRLPAATWLASGGTLLAALLPMTLLGLVLGLWFKPQAASAATTLTMMAMSMIGGLWFPLDMLPSALQTVGKLLPSYWAGQLGTWAILGGGFPWQGVLVIASWTVSLVVLGVLGYRRAVSSSRR